MRTLTALGVFLALAGSALTPQDPVAERPTSRAAVEEPPVPVHVDAKSATVESGATLLEIVNTLAPAAKRSVSVRKEVLPKLQSTRVQLTEPLTVPVARAGELLDTLIFAENIILLPPVKPGLPWKVADLRANDRLWLRESTRQIDHEQIEEYSTKIVLVSAALPVKYTSAREISAALRPFFPDNNLETVTNVGTTNQVLLMGFGPTVAYMARLIRSLDIPKVEEVQIPCGVGLDDHVNLTKRIEALEKQVELLNKALVSKPPEHK